MTKKPPGLPIPGCYSTYSPGKIVIISWIPCLGLACLFFMLTIYRFLDAFRDDGGKLKSSNIFLYKNMAPMVTYFVRDGALFFLFLFAITLICALFDIISASNIVRESPAPWLMAIYAMSSSRLILNLREISLRGRPHQSEFEMSIITTVGFKQRVGTTATSNNLNTCDDSVDTYFD